jgi:hypothetical protein
MWFLNPDDSVYEPRTFLFTLILGFVEYFRRETNIENPRWPIIEAFVEKPVTYSDNRIIDPKLDL